METFTSHSYLEEKKVKKKIGPNLIPRHLASASSDHFVSKMQLKQGGEGPDRNGSSSAPRWAGIWQGPSSGHSPAKPCWLLESSEWPAQVAQGWLRTQPDSVPFQPLAFIRILHVQTQFSTPGEGEEVRILLSPAPTPGEKVPKSPQGQLLV